MLKNWMRGMSAIIDLDEGNEAFCGVTVDYWEGCQWYKRPWVINRVLRLWIQLLDTAEPTHCSCCCL